MILGGETIDILASWGLQTGLMVSVLIGLVLIIRRPFARYFGAGAAYALWLLPLARLFMPNMTVPFLTRSAAEPLAPVQIPLNETILAPTPLPDAITITTAPKEAFNIWPVLTLVWISGAVLWLAYQLLKQNRFVTRMKENSAVISHDFTDAIEASKRAVGLRRLPDIRLSENVSGPMVTGVRSPMILLPADFEKRFSEDQRRFALIHEMAHIKRGDLWVAFIVLAVRALFWPNPLVHYAAHKLRVDQEAACDASVVARTGEETTHSYAETLIHAAKSAGIKTNKAPLGLALMDTPLQSETEK